MMVNAPVVSVLMPVYNAERYVAEAVESILNQTFRDFEFLIVDDGSTDRSLQILRKYERQDSRIRLISRPNTGYVVALNEMLALATGEFIARMDADDVAVPFRFAHQLEHLREHGGCVALGSQVQMIDQRGRPLCRSTFRQTHEEIDAAHLLPDAFSEICNPTVMMRSDAVRAVGGYDASTFGAEDYDLFLKLAERGGTLFNLSDVLLKYRQHFKSIGHAQKARQRQAAQAARRDAYRRRGMTSPTQREPAPPPEPSPAERHAMWAWWALMDRNVNCARIHAWHSLIRRPFAVHSWKLAACAARGF